MTKLHQLADLGQAIWLDYIRRSLLDSGELQTWIEKGLRGVTSNPSIFEKAIAGSSDYDLALQALFAEDRPIPEVYQELALEDIADAADLLRPVYEATDGLDGYVSLEADPGLADDTEGTVAEIRRFHAALDRPNVLFKVPATPAGIPAIETLIASGINVNVTLIFSLAQYQAVAEAYLSGLEALVAKGGEVCKVASVASFFVSRVDRAVDQALQEIGETELQGQIAIANAKAAYALFKEMVNGERWQRLAAQGARVQRLLWASTSTKNPLYPDTMYVDGLIGPHTVNTVPPATLRMFLDHGQVAPTLESGSQKAQTQLARLAELGIDLDAITDKLLRDGVAAFAKAFDALLDSIRQKREDMRARWSRVSIHLGAYQEAVDAAQVQLDRDRIVERIWDHDHTVWKPERDEITNRLGWLHIAEKMLDNLDCLEALADDVRNQGYEHALLLGMGGSSLAPEVLAKTFGPQGGYLDLEVLDSTDPAAVLAHAERLDPARTLFIVATKSGSTTETLSFFKYFLNWMIDAVGQEEAGQHFVAITDPGSKLIDLAQECDFRTTFVNDPNIGGRYSALSYFGLVPAALLGIDLETLLNRALTMSCAFEEPPCPDSENNLGVVLSTLATAGRDKLTLITSPAIASFGDWVEQLIAESTGKEGQGILPVVGEPLGAPEVYGADRVFVDMRLKGDETRTQAVQALVDAGHPVVRLWLRDLYDLGQQFFLWEMATAVASHGLQINPFNQPNVEAAKKLARKMINTYAEKGQLPPSPPTPPSGEALYSFLKEAKPGRYVAIHAYVEPTAATDAALQALRTLLRDRYRLATTVGYGPRFLHSTGQLHKGDAGNGLFIQFTSDAVQDVPIPDKAGATDSSITFGVLKQAQALGDRQALLDVDRRVLHVDLGTEVVAGLERLIRDLG